MIRPIKHVLWATDFSAESKEALAYADLFVKTFKTKLTALHVVPDFAPALYEAWPEAAAELMGRIEAAKVKAKVDLDGLCRTVAVCPDKTLIAQGSPAPVILETAKKAGAGLIVIGRRGTGGPEPNLLGSVAHRVLRGSRVPVLVTKGLDAEAKPIRRILVPTDFSAREDIERDHAWMLAKAFGASLTFLYVLELFGHDLRLTEPMFATMRKKLEARRRREHRAVEMTEDIARAARGWEGITEYAETKGFGLIVMSSRVRRLARLFLGSTTEKVIAHSRVPVYAIPREK
jgi:nucleotide-binding universal stress UspA family protein